MRTQFWGTRGSIPTPGRRTVRYGGNTSCVEVRADDGSLVVLDCGTGARLLGDHLVATNDFGPIWMLLTHFHWDHIQGFPFFMPAAMPGVELHVVGPKGLQRGLQETLAGQMQYNYFPVTPKELKSNLTFHEIGEGSFKAGSFHVQSQSLNHTCPALGYRLTVGGVTLVYATDHEPFWPHDANRAGLDFLHSGDQKQVEFLRGADLVIHDAQYASEEYPARRGWGHSTAEYVVDLALAAGAQKLALFHHDPSHDDDFVDALLARSQERAKQHGRNLGVCASYEGEEVVLQERASAPQPQGRPLSPLANPLGLLLLVGAPEQRKRIRDWVAGEDLEVIDAGDDLDPALPPRSKRPELVVASVQMGSEGRNSLAHLQNTLSGRPLVAILPEGASDGDLLQVAGVSTDVMAEPFSRPMFCSRVRTALSRLAPGAETATRKGGGLAAELS